MWYQMLSVKKSTVQMMFSHLGHSQHGDLQPTLSQESKDDEMTAADDASSAYIVKQLKELYKGHVVDAEKSYHLHFNFCLPTDGEIKDSEFDATPMVLLIGQYSTGKVSVHLICRICVHILFHLICRICVHILCMFLCISCVCMFMHIILYIILFYVVSHISTDSYLHLIYNM